MANHPITGLMLCTLVALVASNGSQSANAAGSAKHDACSFLTAAEVDAVTGTLAGPFYLAGGDGTPRANGGDCRYEAPDRHSIRLNVTWDGGRDLIAMMGSVQAMVDTAALSQPKLLDGTTISGHWDQARINQCCEFSALNRAGFAGDCLV